MAVAIHVVRVAFKSVNPLTGAPIDKNNPDTKIRDVLQTEHRHVVIPDSAVPNSANSPSVDAYLRLEAAGDFVVYHMDQNMIVTYDQGGLNTAT